MGSCKMIAAASLCILILIAAGVAAALVLGASGHEVEHHNGQDTSPTPRRNDLQGHLLLKVADAPSFIADNVNTAVAVAASISWALPQVSTDMVHVRNMSLAADTGARRLTE